MEIKTGKSNIVSVKTTKDGTKQYVVNIGTVLYNDVFVKLENLIIPLSSQSFFSLPDDTGKYTAVNIYYEVEGGSFLFDKLGIYNNLVKSVPARIKPNLIPIAQFILKERDGVFDVLSINEYSQMATFTISDEFEKGDEGGKGQVGETGNIGETGIVGLTGGQGYFGLTGPMGETGVGFDGVTGLPGVTGPGPDQGLIFYLKFKSNDPRQTDYSIYERDVQWHGDLVSNFSVESGVVDNCHFVRYRGGSSDYRRNEYLGWTGETGTIAAWVRADVPPIAEFDYSVIGSEVEFVDQSTYFPQTWDWDFGDGKGASNQNPTHTYEATGTYIVTLTVSNAVGDSTRRKFLEI